MTKAKIIWSYLTKIVGALTILGSIVTATVFIYAGYSEQMQMLREIKEDNTNMKKSIKTIEDTLPILTRDIKEAKDLAKKNILLCQELNKRTKANIDFFDFLNSKQIDRSYRDIDTGLKKNLYCQPKFLLATGH